jgi:hypothetical protein
LDARTAALRAEFFQSMYLIPQQLSQTIINMEHKDELIKDKGLIDKRQMMN